MIVTLEEDTDDGGKTLPHISFNEPWGDSASVLGRTRRNRRRRSGVSDAEEPLVDSFTDEDRELQLDTLHVGWTTGYKLWQYDAFPLAEPRTEPEETVGQHDHVPVSPGTGQPFDLAVAKAEVLLGVLEERFDPPPEAVRPPMHP